MKKSIFKFATICSLFFAVSFSAQAQFIDKGEVIGSAGFYFPSGGTLLRANVDFGVSDNVSLGGHFFTIISGGSGSYVGGRVAYHLGDAFGVSDSRSLDPYVGAQIGKFLITGADIGFGLPIGLRYMFNDKVGLFGEYFITLNGDNSGVPNMFGIGATFRFSK